VIIIGSAQVQTGASRQIISADQALSSENLKSPGALGAPS
jgi:hypothetical protein